MKQAIDNILKNKYTLPSKLLNFEFTSGYHFFSSPASFLKKILHICTSRTFNDRCAILDSYAHSTPNYSDWAFGEDSHRFLPPDSSKPCVIGGIIFEGVPGLDADSDGDVVYHAICNAITSYPAFPF